jgi:hypothetical protein
VNQALFGLFIALIALPGYSSQGTRQHPTARIHDDCVRRGSEWHIFFSNFGPNGAILIIPSQIFHPPSVKAQCRRTVARDVHVHNSSFSQIHVFLVLFIPETRGIFSIEVTRDMHWLIR